MLSIAMILLIAISSLGAASAGRISLVSGCAGQSYVGQYKDGDRIF